MRDPPCAPPDRKHGRGRVRTEPERGGHGGGAEVVVGGRRTGQVHGAYERLHDGEGSAPPSDRASLLDHHVEPWIAIRVQRVPKTGDRVASAQSVAHDRCGVLGLADLLDHGCDPLGYAAMTWAGERRGRRGEAGVEIGSGRRAHPSGEARWVELVIGAHHEGGVQRTHDATARLDAECDGERGRYAVGFSRLPRA